MNGYSIAFTNISRQYQNLKSEILEVTDCVLQSGQLMNGTWTEQFEHWLAVRNNCSHAVTCHSGTQALQIIADFVGTQCLHSPKIVAVPALTFPATVNAWLLSGWQIRLIDVDAYGIMNWHNLTEDSIHAVCAVGLYGHALPDITDYGLVIEDAAQHWLSNQCRRQGLASAISFDPTKNLNNYGNGGAVLTDNNELAAFARNWTCHGKTSQHATAGSNSRISEVDCAQLLVKAQHIDAWQQRRRQIAVYWYDKLKNSLIRSLVDDTNLDQHCIQKFVVQVPDQTRMVNYLKLHGIECKIHYVDSLDRLPIMKHNEFCSNAAYLSHSVVSLPIYPELSDFEVEQIIDLVLSCA